MYVQVFFLHSHPLGRLSERYVARFSCGHVWKGASRYKWQCARRQSQFERTMDQNSEDFDAALSRAMSTPHDLKAWNRVFSRLDASKDKERNTQAFEALLIHYPDTVRPRRLCLRVKPLFLPVVASRTCRIHGPLSADEHRVRASGAAAHAFSEVVSLGDFVEDVSLLCKVSALAFCARRTATTAPSQGYQQR